MGIISNNIKLIPAYIIITMAEAVCNHSSLSRSTNSRRNENITYQLGQESMIEETPGTSKVTLVAHNPPPPPKDFVLPKQRGPPDLLNANTTTTTTSNTILDNDILSSPPTPTTLYDIPNINIIPPSPILLHISQKLKFFITTTFLSEMPSVHLFTSTSLTISLWILKIFFLIKNINSHTPFSSSSLGINSSHDNDHTTHVMIPVYDVNSIIQDERKQHQSIPLNHIKTQYHTNYNKNSQTDNTGPCLQATNQLNTVNVTHENGHCLNSAYHRTIDSDTNMEAAIVPKSDDSTAFEVTTSILSPCRCNPDIMCFVQTLTRDCSSTTRDFERMTRDNIDCFSSSLTCTFVSIDSFVCFGFYFLYSFYPERLYRALLICIDICFAYIPSTYLFFVCLC